MSHSQLEHSDTYANGMTSGSKSSVLSAFTKELPKKQHGTPTNKQNKKAQGKEKQGKGDTAPKRKAYFQQTRIKQMELTQVTHKQDTVTNVVNLSHVSLTSAEISLLSYGLSFAPQTHFVIFSTLLDVNRFIRNVVLRKHFSSLVDSPRASHGDVSQDATNITFNFQDHVDRSVLENLRFESTGGMYGIEKDSDRYYYPVNSRNSVIETFLALVEQDLVQLAGGAAAEPSQNRDNLTKFERSAIVILKSCTDLVIKEAEKGARL